MHLQSIRLFVQQNVEFDGVLFGSYGSLVYGHDGPCGEDDDLHNEPTSLGQNFLNLHVSADERTCSFFFYNKKTNDFIIKFCVLINFRRRWVGR